MIKFPQRLNTWEELEAFHKAQTDIALKDPIQAVCNYQWMLDKVWDRWSSLELATKMRLEAEKKD